MRAWHTNTFPVAKLICIELNLFGTMFTEAYNQVWLDDRRLLDGRSVLVGMKITIGTATVTVEAY